jgi:1-acyl-sn-glycerol-3-phosphate acyltransferase
VAHNQFALLGQRRFAPFFVTQLLGAFNDNVFRNATLALIAIHMGLSVEAQGTYTNLAPGLFILPFFFFSATAGQLAEKFEKTRIIRAVKLFEIAAMAVAAYGFYTHRAGLLLVVLFLMGVHSTVFGPIKYSILPQALKPEELTGGNGLVESGTAMSILFGMMLGIGLIKFGGETAASVAVLAIAVVGYAASRFVPPAPPASPVLRVDWNPLTSSWPILQLCRRQPGVWNSVLGISWFWFFGTALTAQLPVYAELQLGGATEGAKSSLLMLTLGVFSVGTGIGSLLCEKLSHRTVEIGLVPLGALGITAFGIDLYFARHGLAPVAVAGLADFVRGPGAWRVLLDLGMIGVFGGLYLVPLFALVQGRTPKAEVSRVIAGNNIVNAVFIVAAAGSGLVAQKLLHWTIPQFYLAIAIANGLVALYIFSLVPEFLMRFVAWVLTHLLYRAKAIGIDENVPDDGPALVVCNHVSYMDPLVLMGAIPRPTRFVMYHKIFNTPGLSWLFRNARAIPIANRHEDAALMEAAFAEVDKALSEGEIVGIFPEGKLTTDGEIAAFKAGVERILAARPVPVVPMALRGMWASVFSKQNARWGRLPKRLRARIELEALPPVDGATATAASLEAMVRALRGDRK